MKLDALMLTAAVVAISGCQQAAQPAPAIAAAAAAPSSLTSPDERPQAGRYQLFQGWYRFVNLKGEEHRTETLFKIDTMTGEMIECSSVQFVQESKGRQIRTCVPFESDHPISAAPARAVP